MSVFVKIYADCMLICPRLQIYLVRGEAEPSDVNAVDFIITSARQKVKACQASAGRFLLGSYITGQC